MQSLSKIAARYPKYEKLIESFAKVQHEPLFFVAEDEELLGANEQALNALGYESYEKLEIACSKRISSLFLKNKGFFIPQNGVRPRRATS